MFSNSRSRLSNLPSVVTAQGTQIEFVSTYKYLDDVLYMHATSQSLQSMDAMYHGALRFITNFKSLTHHCLLYARVGCSSVCS